MSHEAQLIHCPLCSSTRIVGAPQQLVRCTECLHWFKPGATVDPGCQCICHEYPEHGTLQDALEALKWHQAQIVTITDARLTLLNRALLAEDRLRALQVALEQLAQRWSNHAEDLRAVPYAITAQAAIGWLKTFERDVRALLTAQKGEPSETEPGDSNEAS